MPAREIKVEIVGDASSFVKASDAVARESGQLTGTFDKLQRNASEANRALEKTPDHLNAAGEAGGDMESAFRGVLDVTGAVTEQFGVALPAGLETGLQGITDIGGGVESFIRGAPGFLAAAVSMTTAIWAQVTALTAQAAAFIVANAPIIAIIAALALLAAGVYLVVQHWDTLVEKFPILQVAMDAVKAKFEEFKAWLDSSFMPGLIAIGVAFQEAFQKIAAFVDTYLAPAFEKMAAIVGAAGAAVIGFIHQHWGTIEAILMTYVGAWLLVIQTAWDHITNVFSLAFGVITGLTNIFVGLLTGDWERAWLGARQIVDSVITFIKDTVQMGLNFITGLFNLLPGDIGKALTNVLTTVHTYIDLILGFFTSMPSALYEAGQAAIRGFFNGIVNTFNAAIGAIKSMINPKNWDIPGGSPLMHAMDEFGNEAGTAFVEAYWDAFTEKWIPKAAAAAAVVAGSFSGPGWNSLPGFAGVGVATGTPLGGSAQSSPFLNQFGEAVPDYVLKNSPYLKGLLENPAGQMYTDEWGNKLLPGGINWDWQPGTGWGAGGVAAPASTGNVKYGFGNSAANPITVIQLVVDGAVLAEAVNKQNGKSY